MDLTPRDNQPAAAAPERKGSAGRLVLRLYVAESAPNSEEAESNLRALLGVLPAEMYSLEVVDCLREPLRALHDDVIVTPMLIRVEPEPVRRIVGTLRDRGSVAGTLGLPAQRVAEGSDG